MIARSRQAAALAVDATCALVGRRQFVRAARFALHRARLDLPNRSETNGEYALQRWVLATARAAEPLTMFDVGANVGAWSQALLDSASESGCAADLRLHAFEPASYTYGILSTRLPQSVRTNRVAVSNRSGETTLYVIRPGAGTNSLHDMAHESGLERECVETTTIDEYVARNGIQHIALLKIDTEGHDFLVLSGAERCFRTGSVSVAQFEYNHRWIGARCYLKDVFDFMHPLGYQVGKLTPRGVEFYPAWDPELETFIEANYVACHSEMAARLPQVQWWKR